MTNQSQSLTLKLSNGQEVSLAEAKSVLRLTEDGQQRSCAIVQGPNGAAIYNAEGEVKINGATSSAHWLKTGDTLQFGDNLSASVEQLGVASQAIDSLLHESLPEEVQVEAHPEAPTDVAPTQAIEAAASEADQDTFTPATAAASFVPEPQATPEVLTSPEATTAPEATIPEATTPAATAPDLVSTAADIAIPAATAATLAALGVSTISAEPAEQSLAASPEPTGFAPATDAVAEPEAATANESATDLPTTGFAAELLARIQADENNNQPNEDTNETVGTDSETTHSPLAADGQSFSSPADETTSISSLIPELPSSSASGQYEQLEDQPEPLETSLSQVETSTAESAERQTQSSSVSALLERMKAEGKLSEADEEVVEEAPVEAPVMDEADEDVQSYMSQLLSRMRDPNEEAPRPAATVAAAPKEDEPKAEVVAAPKPAGLLKPEEYVPKTKACRLDSLQDMRALANTQTRTAIDRSQAKRRQASIGIVNLSIGVGGCVMAAIIFALSFVGYPIVYGSYYRCGHDRNALCCLLRRQNLFL